MSTPAPPDSPATPDPTQRQWFARVVQDHYRLLFATAYRVLRNGKDAEEATQEACLKGLRSLATLENPDTVVGWLARITTNTALDMLRKGGGTKIHSVGIDVSVLERRGGKTENDRLTMNDDDRAVLQEEIASLPPGQAAALTLRFFDGLDVQQVAARLGIEPNNARVRLHRAVERLKANPRVRRALGMDD